MIGRDEKMMLVFESIRTVAKTDLAVLILGPTGSGKEVVARIIHELSSRQHETFQAVNCAALPDSLFESEVFGYERGAFTGAYERKPGRIELANHGTLFLDEVGDLSPLAQAKLLRVVEEHRVERLGGAHEHRSRLPAHLRDQPSARIARGRRRVPRRPVLPHQRLHHSAARAARAPGRHPGAGRPLPGALLRRPRACRSTRGASSPDALDLLLAYPWPGNIRELETTVSRAALSAHDGVVRAEGPAVPAPGDGHDRARSGRAACRCATSSATTSAACSTP